MSFEIKLPLFEGPFDLLLFFIERDELNIYDIPIGHITEDFLSYLHQLETLNMEVASEFIVVAATLMRIKAKMLLPRNEENPADDPRKELIQSLLEYKKYRSLVPLLEQMEEEQQQKELRANLHQEELNISESNEVEFEMYHLDLYKLLRVYERLIKRHEDRTSEVRHTIVPYPYTVSQQRDYILEKVVRYPRRIAFHEIISDYVANSKIAAIFNFLAILELLQSKHIILYMEEEDETGYNNFWIEANPNPDEYVEKPITLPE